MVIYENKIETSAGQSITIYYNTEFPVLKITQKGGNWTESIHLSQKKHIKEFLNGMSRLEKKV